MAAYHLLASQKYEISVLLTTVTEEFDRISMHGVRRELLEQQAKSPGIPLHQIMIPKDCPNEIYEGRMREVRDLPESADPCGEYGEYHSFVYDGPIFKTAIACRKGGSVMRSERFNYCDIVSAWVP